MHRSMMKVGAVASCILSFAAACGSVDGGVDTEDEGVVQTAQAVSGLVLQQRGDKIKASALTRGITNALVIAGVGYHETGSCGYRVCGGDHQFYDCKSTGWTGTGAACSSTQ